MGFWNLLASIANNMTKISRTRMEMVNTLADDVLFSLYLLLQAVATPDEVFNELVLSDTL